jgi:uncharacterized protein YaaQ
MKLIVAIVQLDDAPPVVSALTEERISATIIEAHGGFLRDGVAAILIGLDDRLVSRALAILGRYCQVRRTVLPDEFPHELQEWALPEVMTAEVGGATAFVLPVVRFERF